MSSKDDVNAVGGLTTSSRGFGTFPRSSSRPKPTLPPKKPVVPPKPKKVVKPAVGHTTSLANKEVSNYFEAFPVKRIEAMEIENQNYYDSAVPVRMESLEIDDDYGYETIGEPRSSVTGTCHDPDEPLYDEASTTPRPILRRLNSKCREVESTEDYLSDEENPDADFYILQKYRNQSRASWIDRVESMSNKDIVQAKRRTLGEVVKNFVSAAKFAARQSYYYDDDCYDGYCCDDDCCDDYCDDDDDDDDDDCCDDDDDCCDDDCCIVQIDYIYCTLYEGILHASKTYTIQSISYLY